MAGFFGLFNYEKEGPGVSKNEPEKKGFIRFFSLYFSNFWKLLTVGLLQLLFCVPVVTYGLGEVGIAHVARNISIGKHSFGTSDFFDTIKRNWKQALPVGIVNLLLNCLLLFDLYYFFPRKDSGMQSSIFTGITLFLLFTLTVMRYYMPLLMITFSLKFRQLYKNCFRFVFLNLWKNLLIFICLTLFNAAAFLLLLYGKAFGILFSSLLWIFIYPGFRAMLIQFNIFGSIRKFMIDPYYAEHPEADVEKRLALGIYVAPEYLPDYARSDTVFDDEQKLPETAEDEEK